MSTLEHLFMQIFDRKRWIEDQLEHQIESYGESLTSNLLAGGHCPPPWLWNSRSDGLSWLDRKELNREQIISEILDPLPRVTTTENNNTLFVIPTLKGSNVDLFNSNSFFTKALGSNKYFEAKASNELVFNDVPAGSKQISETIVEPELAEYYSKLRHPTRTRTSTPKHWELDMPPFKKAKTVNHLVEDNTRHEFTGRVTRSMATCLYHDYVKDNGKTTRSSSTDRKHCSVGQSSKLAKPQKDVLSVPSASIDNDEPTTFVANDLYLDSACAAHNGCHITNSLSSKLSAISLLSEPEDCVDDIEGCRANTSSVSTFEAENHESTSEVPLLKLDAANILPCQDSFASTPLNEDILHASGTKRRTEEADRDPTEGPIEELHEVVDLECDSPLVCHDCKPSGMTDPSSSNEMACQSSGKAYVSSFLVSNCKLNDFPGHLNEPQVGSRESAMGSLQENTPEEHCSGKMTEFSGPNLDIFIRNDRCDLNRISVAASVEESKNGLEAVSETVKTVLQIEEVNRASNGGPEEGAELPGRNSVCITHPTASIEDCWIFENSLSNSSPRKDCMLMDSSRCTSDLSDISRKNSFKNPVNTEKEVCCAKPKEVLTDVSLAEKSENIYPVKTVHIPLNISSENIVADSDSANIVLIGGQDERSDIVGTRDWGCQPHVSVYNADASLPAISPSNENASAYSSPDLGNIFNSMQGLSAQPNVMQDNGKARLSEIPMQYTEVEKSTGEPEIETTGGSREWTDIMHIDGPVLYFSEIGGEETDNSTKEISQRSIARSLVSPDAFHRQDEMLEGKRDAEEMGTVKDRITPDAEKKYGIVSKARYFLRSSTSRDKHYASPESSTIDDSNNLRQVNHGYDITWPKRKKLKGRSNNVLATSPRLRVKTQKHIEEHIDCSCRTSLKNTSESSTCFQPSMLSCKMEAELSEATLGQFEEEHLSKKRRVMEGDPDLTVSCQAVRTPLSVKHVDEYLDLADEDSSAITQSNVLNLEQYNVLQGRQDSLDRFDHGSPIEFGSFEESADVGQMHTGEGSSYTHDSTGLSQQDGIDLVGLEEIMPEFEGFSISVPPIVENDVTFSDSEISSLSKERASLLEQLCKSETMLATKACLSSKYNIHKIPDAYHSLPGDIFEQFNLSNSLHINGIDLDQFRTIKDDKPTDPCCSLGSEFDGSLLKSHAYNFPSSNAKYVWEAGKPPLIPPVEKLQYRMISRKSVASSEELGSNPELVCFRIDENSSTTGEEPTSEQGVGSRGVRMSSNRTALADITSVYQNIPTSVCVCGKYQERGSLDSANTAPRLDIDDKENDNPVSQSSMQSSANSFHSRVSKPNASGKANERNRGETVSEKCGKPSNIVSNVSSFIPLVREKQQTAAPGNGKRDIKVKALEAAEAAKHLEEKRQYEREKRKAAVKLERVRLEQENIRQLELKQKQKDESRKKKEADLEARKRQREVEKFEKERKKRCTEEARKQQRVNVEKLRIEKGDKELRDKNANEKKRKGKELPKEAKKQALAKGSEVVAWRKTTEVELSISRIVSGDPEHVNNCGNAHDACLQTNDSNKEAENSYELQNAIQDRMSVTAESLDLQLYEITPYKDSDDEDGDEDHIRQRKHIPLWARKESLNQILLSKRHLDPDEVFSRKSSFDLNEVLLPQVPRGPLP